MLDIVAAAAALNVAVVAPAATVTDEGTVSKLLLLDNVTADPPVGAAVVNVNVHVADVPGPKLAGAQEIEVMFGTVMTAPAVADTLIPFPPASTAIGLDIAIEVVVAVGAMVALTYAATPEAIVFAFIPVTRQVIDPAADVQVTALLAAVAAGPVVTETLEI